MGILTIRWGGPVQYFGWPGRDRDREDGAWRPRNSTVGEGELVKNLTFVYTRFRRAVFLVCFKRPFPVQNICRCN